MKANSVKLFDSLDSDSKSYLKLADKRSGSERALIYLITTEFKGLACKAVIESSLQTSLTKKFLYSLVRSGATHWIANILIGHWSDCPIEKSQGVYGHPVAMFFVLNGENIANAILAEKEKKSAAASEKRKATKLANEQAKQAEEKISVVAEVLCTGSSVFAAWLTLSESEQGDFAKRITAHKKQVKQSLANVI